MTDRTAAEQAAAALRALEGLRSAMRFVLALYEPGQRHLDTEAWKSAESGARYQLAEAEKIGPVAEALAALTVESARVPDETYRAMKIRVNALEIENERLRGRVSPDREALARRLTRLAVVCHAANIGIDGIPGDCLIADALAFVRLSSPSPAVGEWRLIDEMPKDGTRFEAWPGLLDSGPAIVIAWWYVHPSTSGWITNAYDCGDYEFAPTHGRLIPAPPQETKP